MMKKSLVFAAVMVMATAMAVSAQSANFNNSPASMTITGTVGQVQRIELPGDQAFDLTGNAADGTVDLGTMSVFSNVNYSVTVASTAGFALASSATGETLSYDLAVGGSAVDENSGAAIGSTGRTVGGSDDYTLELTYDQDTADTLAQGSDYSDTLEFTIASP